VFPSLVYFLVLAREEPSYPFIGFNAVCLLVSITNLLLARFTEPGLLRTNPAMGSVPIQEFKQLVKRKQVTVMCGDKECTLYEARAKICGETGNAIEKFDHFCPWVGNAVGVRNHRYFVFFTFSTTLLAIGTGAGSVYFLVMEGMDGIGVAAIGLLIYCTIITCCVGGLATYHCGLVCNNATTNEEIKNVWERTRNPHDRGCCANFNLIMCNGPRPSYICERFEDLNQHTDLEQGKSAIEEQESKESLSGGAAEESVSEVIISSPQPENELIPTQ